MGTDYGFRSPAVELARVTYGDVMVTGSGNGASFHHDAVLAEYTALRQELEGLSGRLQSTFTLQLVATATLFSFALSDPKKGSFLLVLPIVSYALCARAMTHRYGIRDIARYISEQLSPRISGELPYEEWFEKNNSLPRFVAFTHPYFVAFFGSSLGSLVWTIPLAVRYVRINPLEGMGFSASWAIGLLATLGTLRLLLKVVFERRRYTTPA
jgi:hypothetical protein